MEQFILGVIFGLMLNRDNPLITTGNINILSWIKKISHSDRRNPNEKSKK
jgi:hypothetical protein